jgi:hypothetical protein
MNDPHTGYAMPRMPQQTQMQFAEVDEISHEDLEAAAEKFDDIKVNPDKYFTTKYHDARKIVLTLEKAARSCIVRSEKINTEVNGNWTNRRQKFADSAAKKKDRLIKWAQQLNTLAIMWDANDVPELLSNIRSATDLEWLSYHGYPNVPDKDHPIDGWYRKEYPVLLKKATKFGLKSKEDSDRLHIMLDSLGSIKLTPEQEKEKLIKNRMKDVHRFNIPGFFPTPDEVIDKMIQYSRLENHHTLLEPSAGIGNILDRVKFHGIECRIDAVEIRPALEEILRLKGYNSSCEDIMDTTEVTGSKWNRILMNPPFEHGQDIEHVRHCFDTFLADNGILVSVMSAGVITNSYAKYVDFRNWVEELNGFYVELGQAFKEAFNSTGVSTVILVLKK